MTLPAVASNFYTECKKCGCERYHKVVTHPTPDSAKLKCEVCGKSSTFKLSKPSARKLSGAAAALKEKKLGAKKNAYISEYELLTKNTNSDQALPYNMRIAFKESQLIQHGKFGLGFVKSVAGDKIEVFFSDEARFLVHNRPS